jgi:multidrug efflux pump
VLFLGTGVVALAGGIVGHNIVLVDTLYQLRGRVHATGEAGVRAATRRFRPVMLTTLVTVAGLLPLTLQIHPNFRIGRLEYKAPGSEWWVQLSGAVVWGLSFATVLTQVLAPMMLVAPQMVSEGAAALWRRLRRKGSRSAARRGIGLAALRAQRT